jgi:hypothetical protein
LAPGSPCYPPNHIDGFPRVCHGQRHREKDSFHNQSIRGFLPPVPHRHASRV